MATIHQALRFLKTHHYHRLIPHQKHFVNQMLEGISGMGEVSDQDITDYLSPKQEKFVWVLSKRFGINITKEIFPLKPKIKKPDLPFKTLTYQKEPEEKTTIQIKWTNNKFYIHTGLGTSFDDIAIVDQLASYRPSKPYDMKFHNRPLITVYGMTSKAGWPIGRAYLEMVSTSANDPLERAKISAFLAAMERIDIDEINRPSKPKKPRKSLKNESIKAL